MYRTTRVPCCVRNVSHTAHYPAVYRQRLVVVSVPAFLVPRVEMWCAHLLSLRRIAVLLFRPLRVTTTIGSRASLSPLGSFAPKQAKQPTFPKPRSLEDWGQPTAATHFLCALYFTELTNCRLTLEPSRSTNLLMPTNLQQPHSRPR